MSSIYEFVDWDQVKDLSVEEQVNHVSKAVALTQPTNEFFRTKVFLTWIYCKYKERLDGYPKLVVLPEEGREVGEGFACSTLDLVVQLNTANSLEMFFIVQEDTVIKNAKAFIGVWDELMSEDLE